MQNMVGRALNNGEWVLVQAVRPRGEGRATVIDIAANGISTNNQRYDGLLTVLEA